VPLPEWAPENPSPEFLRAAQILRGVPMDAVGRGDMPEQSWRALLAYMKQVNPTLWQLFGSLTDAQIDNFLSAKQIAIPVRDLAPKQRTALEAVLDANKGKAIEMSGVSLPDFRTLLYKMGARQDLSDVTIGFTIEGANMLSFNARVHGVKDPLVWTGWAQVARLGSSTGAATASVPLPEWAPKNPSPEFLRAARVFKTWVNESPISDEPELAGRALQIRFRHTLVPAWEFFGSLTDEQIERFRATRDLRIQVKDLTDKRRAALYRFFDVWRQEFKGVSSPNTDFSEDWLVDLYKLGAKEDLSNVEIQFRVRGSGRVAMILRSRQPDGSLGPPCPIGLGDM
jgi:hypothetical protein